MSLKRIKQILKRKAPKPRSPIFTAARQQCHAKTFRHKNDRRSLRTEGLECRMARLNKIQTSILEKLRRTVENVPFDPSDEMAWKNEFWDAFYKSLSQAENDFLSKKPEFVRLCMIDHVVIKDDDAQSIAKEFLMRGKERCR